MLNIFENNFSDKFKNKYVYFILFLIITLTLTRLIILFSTCKQGHHSDEAWSYGFANSYYDPYDYLDVNNYIIGNDFKTSKNYQEWVPGSYFKEYVTVDKGEQFAYKSVIYNKLNDMSPALYALLLHTICSFFPGVFSWWFGFSINIICYIFIELLLYKISLNISNNKIFSLIIPLYYGLSRAALNTVLYIRMYALLTMIILIMVYETQKIIQKNYTKCAVNQIIIILTVFLGGFTHFYALIFDFFFALVYVLYLLIKKEWRNSLTLGGTFLLGAILYVIIYPFGLLIMMNGSDFYTLHFYPYRIELELLINYITRDCFGINYSYDVFDLLDTFVIITLVVVFWLLCHFIFRKDEWMHKIVLKEKGINKKIKDFTYGKAAYRWLCKKNELPGLIVFSSLLTSLFIVKFSNISTMQYFSDRYVFMILPLIELAVIYILFSVSKKIFNDITRLINIRKPNINVTSSSNSINKISKNKFQNFDVIKHLPFFLFVIILIVTTLSSMTGIQVYYFTQSTDDFNLENYLTDKNVIIFDNTPWHLEWYATEIYESNYVFMVGDEYNEKTLEDITNLDSTADYVFILSKSASLMSVTIGSVDESEVVSAQESSSDYLKQIDLLNSVCESLDLTPELVTDIGSFCGNLEIYSLTK